MIRVAATGDLHFGRDSAGSFRPVLHSLADEADVLLIAGDLTRVGDPEEAAVLARELGQAPVPVVAVLGNHDFESDQQDEVRQILESAGVRILEGEGVVLEFDGATLGVAGGKGFGGGFAGAHGSDFGEPEMKAFVRHTKALAAAMEASLKGVFEAGADVVVALMHYAPVRDTLRGEPPEIYPFLGSFLLGEAVDRAGADLALHGHAHRGTEKGITPGGVHVRNVAQPVIRRAFNVYCLEPKPQEEFARS